MTYLISILQAIKEHAEAQTRVTPAPTDSQAVEQYILTLAF